MVTSACRPIRNERAPARRVLLAVAFVFNGFVAIAAPHAAAAQILDDWRIVYSDSAFDYLVTERGMGMVDTSEGRPLLRVAASRMLVRYIDRARAGIVAERRRLGAPVAGYDRLASSTYLLDIDCDSRTAGLIESTDFDDDGEILSRRRLDRSLGSTFEGWSNPAVSRLIAWACSRSGGGRPGRLQTGENRPTRTGRGLSTASLIVNLKRRTEVGSNRSSFR